MGRILTSLSILSDYKQFLCNSLGNSDIKGKIAESYKDTATSFFGKDTVSKATGNAVSNVSSFGIGIGLAFLAQYLAINKRESPTANNPRNSGCINLMPWIH